MGKPKASRTRTSAQRDDGERAITTTTLTTHQVQLRLQRWRALKKRFDHVHQAGMMSLKRRDFGSLHAAILHERRIIDELKDLIGKAKAHLGYETSP